MMNYKQLTAIAAASLLASIANAEWNYGIDFSEFKTGVTAMQRAALEWAQS